MNIERAGGSSTDWAIEALEQIHQLAIGGVASMNSTVTMPHINAVAEAIFEVIAEKSIAASEKLQ